MQALNSSNIGNLRFYGSSGGGGGGSGVTKIIAGTNITISPTSGVGNVTINANVSTNPESFSITIDDDFSADQGDNAFTNWVDTVNTTAFPTVNNSVIYSNLTAGSLDLTNGSFTCGVSGDYYISLSVYNWNNLSGYIYVKDVTSGDMLGLYRGNVNSNSFSNTFELVATHIYQLTIYNVNASPQTFPFSETISDVGGTFNYPNLIWSVALAGGISGVPPSTGPIIERYSVDVTSDALASGGTITIVPNSPSYQYVILNICVDASNTTAFSNTVGDRNVIFTDGTNQFGIISRNSLIASGVNSFGWVINNGTNFGIWYPFTSPLQPTTVGNGIRATYSGGTTDYPYGGSGRVNIVVYKFQ